MKGKTMIKKGWRGCIHKWKSTDWEITGKLVERQCENCGLIQHIMDEWVNTNEPEVDPLRDYKVFKKMADELGADLDKIAAKLQDVK